MTGVQVWVFDPSTKEWVPVKSDANGVQEVWDPKVGSLISFEGTTTLDGAGDGSTLICSDLTTEADFDGNQVIITSGDYAGQARDINGTTLLGTVSPLTAFGGRILSGVTFTIAAIRTTAYTRLAGVLQMAATTIELNQGIGAKDLFTGTAQDVVVEKLMIRIPVDVSGGAMTSLSIQTDDTTAQVFIDSTTGAKANLTAQAQLSWTGAVLIKVGKKVQLTIAGAATGIACSCDVIAESRAVVSGGYLA